MVPAETGENEVVFCEACGYAANIEKATSGIPKTAAREVGAAIEKFATPGVVTIEALEQGALQSSGQSPDQNAGLHRRQQAGHCFDSRRRPVE